MKELGSSLHRFVLAWLALSLSAMISIGQSVKRFDLSPPPPQVPQGGAVLLAIRAIGVDGAPLTNWQGQVRASSFSPTTSPPVISEIDRRGDAVEVTNPGDRPVDIGDWELQLLPDYSGQPMNGRSRLRFPAGTVMPPRSVLSWSSQGTAPGAYPVFVSDHPLDVPGFPFGLVRLIDSKAVVVDEVFLQPAGLAPPSSIWRSPGISDSSFWGSHTRVGDANHFGNSDWTTNVPTIGAVNSNLHLPWINAGNWKDTTPSQVTLTNGAWSGTVVLAGSALGVSRLLVDDGNGVSGWSTDFEVVPLPPLVLSPGLLTATESQPGVVGQIAISIPAAAGSNLPVTITLSDTNEFLAPASVVIQAGTNSLLVTVTNLDDFVADGTASVTLTASAPGFASATAVLLNEDNEVGRLFVSLPAVLYEGEGFTLTLGEVFLDQPAHHDVIVYLTAALPVEVPESIVIPAGQLSQTFYIRVGDDLVVNPADGKTRVWAETPGWPRAEGVTTLVDNDDATFELVIPGEVVEGTPVAGIIRFRIRHAEDMSFDVICDSPRLIVPTRVTVAAGQLEASFPMVVPDNSQVDRFEFANVCISWMGSGWTCQRVSLRDDEVNIDHLSLEPPPLAVLSGEPLVLEAALVDQFLTPQRVSVPGQLRLLVDPSVAQLTPGSDSVQFTNGLWRGLVSMTGESLSAELQLTAAGETAVSRRFDLLAGHEVSIDIADLVWHAASGKLLVAERSQTNLPARLTEIDPRTGARGRSLVLPRDVQRIALSDDGHVAWLASTQGTMQRVDLAAWVFAREFLVDGGSSDIEVRDLVVVTGEPESVVAAVGTGPDPYSRTWRLVMFDHGVPRPLQPNLPSSPLTLAFAEGRSAGEVFCQSFAMLSRLTVVTNGIVVSTSVAVTAASSEKPSLSRSGDRVFRGYGDVYSADNLAPLNPFVTQGSLLGCAVDERGQVMFLNYNGALQSFDRDSGALIGAHSVPEGFGWPLRLIHWGDRGLAYYFEDAGSLTVFESPLLNQTLPDLALTVSGPALVEIAMTNGHYLPTTFDWAFAITNHGTAHAFGVRLELDTGEFVDAGTLAPGKGAVVTMERGVGYVGILSSRAKVTSLTSDANSADNEATVVTLAKTPDLPGTKQLILGMTHLIGSPSRTRLYASLSHSVGAPVEGVAVIDPEAGVVERILPVGPDPRRLAISDDGTRLYVLLGTNTLSRWNLNSSSNEVTVVFTNQSVTDFQFLPGTTHSLLVSSSAEVALFDDDQRRPLAVDGSLGYLGFVGNRHWAVNFRGGFELSVANDGVSFVQFFDFAVPAVDLGFAADDRYLYFYGGVFDTTTLQPVNVSLPGTFFLAESGSGAVIATIGGSLARYATSTFTNTGNQLLPQARGYLLDPVRWGQDGIAVRTSERQLLLAHSPLVPTGVIGDVAVSISPPLQPIPYEVAEWTIIVTNASGQTARDSELTIEFQGAQIYTDYLRFLETDRPLSIDLGSKLYWHLGDLGPGTSTLIRLRGAPEPQDFTMTATVVSGVSETNLTNNAGTVSCHPEFPVADLRVYSVQAPHRVEVGDVFEATCVITNAGPGPAYNEFVSTDSQVEKFASLQLSFSAALELVDVACDGCLTNENRARVLFDPVPSGAGKSVTFRMRATRPGLLLVNARTGSSNDPRVENNFGSDLVYLASTNGASSVLELDMPEPLLSWDRSRQQMIAAFPDRSPSLYVLNPTTLEPQTDIPLGGLPRYIASCNDGRHEWVYLDGGEAVRVDVVSNLVDLRFQLDPVPSVVWSIATPPGQPDVLVVALETSNDHLRVYDRGIPRSDTYGPIYRSGDSIAMLFAPDGKLYVASYLMVRELQLVPSGFQELRRFDDAWSSSNWSISYATNRLFLEDGRVVRLDTGTADDRWRTSRPLVADVATSSAYTGSTLLTWGGEVLTVQGIDAMTLEPQWRFDLPDPAARVYSILPMGTNGLIAIGDKARVIRPGTIGPRQVDLGIGVSVPAVIGAAQMVFPISVNVTNRSAWAAQNAMVQLELSPSLIISQGQPGAGSNATQIALGSVGGGTNFGGTNFIIYVSATTNGNHLIRASVTNALAEVAIADNEYQTTTTVLPPPVFLFDDTALNEGSQSYPGTLVGRISRPAPVPLSVNFTITPTTAQVADFLTLNGSFFFDAGQSLATVAPVRGDSTPELDERAIITFSSDQVTFARTSAVVTIVNDDWPQVTVAGIAVKEGNSGFTNAQFRATLKAKAPFPVEVRFTTLAGTATPDLDYLPREGWIRFAPNEDFKVIPVPVRGDTSYEPDETASFTLLSAMNADFGTAQVPLTIRNDDLPPAPVANVRWTVGDGLTIGFPTVIGATYGLETRTNLTVGTWQAVFQTVTGNGQAATFTLGPQSDPQSYYRITVR